MEPSTIATLSTAVSTVISLVRNLSEATKSADIAKMHSIIIDLQQAIMDIQLQQQKLIEDNARLREEKRDLSEKLQTQENLEYYCDAYWIRKSNGSLDGPYSQIKWDEERLLVRMVFSGRDNFGGFRDGVRFCYEYYIYKERKKDYCVVPYEFLVTNAHPNINEYFKR
jgi:regulator of replication initiation timing